MKNKKEVELSLDAMCEHITNQEIKSAKARQMSASSDCIKLINNS
jgi:hypothetical protein